MAKEDPFYVVGQVFVRAAMEWNQVINFLEDEIRQYLDTPQQNIPNALDQLRHQISFIDRTVSTLNQHTDLIRNQSNLGWPQCTSTLLRGKMKSFRKILLQDYAALATRCRSLSQRAETGSGTLLRELQAEELAKSIEKTNKVNYVTMLAYVFVPISLATGIFGMNVDEITDSGPPIWYAVAVSAGLLALAGLTAFWFEISGALKSAFSNAWKWLSPSR